MQKVVKAEEKGAGKTQRQWPLPMRRGTNSLETGSWHWLHRPVRVQLRDDMTRPQQAQRMVNRARKLMMGEGRQAAVS